MNTLFDILKKPVLFHLVLYQGKNGIATSPTAYLSNDPDVIGDQLSAMQNLGGPGCGVIGLTYGPTVSSFINSAEEVCAQCAEREMPFALCYDPWVVKNPDGSMPTVAIATQKMIAALENPITQAMMDSKTYISSINGISGKLVLDFGTTATPSAVTAAMKGTTYWQNSVDYAWPLIADNNGPAPVNNTTAKLPCVCRAFNDGTGPNRNVSIWTPTKPARIIPANAGSYFWSLANAMNPAAEYAQVVTWNDVLEGTDIESFAAILYGKI